MEINPLYRVSPLAPAQPGAKVQQDLDLTKAVVTAVREANKTELLGSNRELYFTRDSQTRANIIQIRDRNTGEVLDQIPSEQILHILADLTNKSERDDSSL